MSLHKSEDFISDVERQFEWYVTNANWDIAERYLESVVFRRAMHGHRDLPKRLS